MSLFYVFMSLFLKLFSPFISSVQIMTYIFVTAITKKDCKISISVDAIDCL